MQRATDLQLEYLPIKITLKAVEDSVLPEFLGSALRGVTGNALRPNKELYQYLYDNRSRSDNEKDIVNPYLLVPPINGKSFWKAEELMNFEILLLGNSSVYAKDLVDALVRYKTFGLGISRHPFIIEKISHSINQRIIWKDGVYHLSGIESMLLPWHTLQEVNQVLITTNTPIRIRRDGNLLTTLDFSTIIRNIIKRLEAVTDRYGGWINKEEADRIMHLSEEVVLVRNYMKVHEMTRYSNRQKAKLDFSGLSGMVHYMGDITPFVPWLFTAQILNLGRNTTFGMGKIELEFI